MLAISLSGLSTEGDFGRDRLRAVATIKDPAQSMNKIIVFLKAT